MKDKKKVEIIQTIGMPHSGSTLFSIIICSKDGFFNAGELKNITRDTLPLEYCSCGTFVSDCDFWQKVFDKWKYTRTSSFKEYKYLYLKYERVSGIPKILWNKLFASKAYKTYISDTEKLYKIIYKLSDNSVIVDSSKMPQRTLILSEFARVKILHLCRDFKGILNSSKKKKIKDLNRGIEKTRKPGRTPRTFIVWIWINLSCEIIALFHNSYKIKYKDFIADIASFSKVDKRLTGINQFSTFNTEHMIAGNRMRLEKNIKIQKSSNKYKNLNKINFLFASMVDKFFFFWS